MKVAVLGLGLSGIGALKLALKNGFDVIAIDREKRENLTKKAKTLLKSGIPFYQEEEFAFKKIDILVVSPGVPNNNPIILEALKKGIKVISEIEFAYGFKRGKIVAITGSNGKSTTTKLIYRILKSFYKDTRLGGNIGIAFSELVEGSTDETIFVLEISSFQLEQIDKFKPDVSVLLNITPDHQDRYLTFKDYVKAKFNLFKNQKENDFAVLNHDDELIFNSSKTIKVKKFYFSTQNELKNGAYLKDDGIYLKNEGDEIFVIKRDEIPIKGLHNVENTCASIIVASIFGVPLKKIKSMIKTFRGLPHRLEFIGKIKGVEFYNDSKATNIDSTLKALSAFEKNVILLLGGKDKGADFEKLKEEVKKKCKRIIAFGMARDKVEKVFRNIIDVDKFETLKEAVKFLKENSKSGEIVLLSPACASFDEFKNYEDRGKKFKKWVLEG